MFECVGQVGCAERWDREQQQIFLFWQREKSVGLKLDEQRSSNVLVSQTLIMTAGYESGMSRPKESPRQVPAPHLPYKYAKAASKNPFNTIHKDHGVQIGDLGRDVDGSREDALERDLSKVRMLGIVEEFDKSEEFLHALVELEGNTGKAR